MIAAHDRIRTLVSVKSDFGDETIPAGTQGTVVECYSQPVEGYAVDLELNEPGMVGGKRYTNVVLYPGQFEVLGPNSLR